MATLNPTSSSASELSIPIFDKLCEDNFPPWQQLALFAIKSQNLEDHLHSAKVPRRYLSDDDESKDKENPTYSSWMLQDFHLINWLLMDASFKNRMIGCLFAHEVWGRVQTYFATATRAKIKQLKSRLKGIKKLGQSCSDYLVQIRRIVDSLNALGHPVSIDDHIEFICDGLGEEYKIFITTVQTRPDWFTLGEIEAMLMSHEEMLDKFNKAPLGFARSDSSDSRSYGGAMTLGGRGRNFRSWQLGNKPQCQLCGRFGHLVLNCSYRFDPNFTGSNSTPSSAPPPPPQSFHHPQAFLATPSAVPEESWHPDTFAFYY